MCACPPFHSTLRQHNTSFQSGLALHLSTTFIGPPPPPMPFVDTTHVPLVPRSMTSSSSSPSTSKHNVATFAGAVGGSVGLLSILALSLALSIYRRRSRARRRDRAYREAQRDAASISESYHTDASEDAPPMQGPAPFVPRYFPGTLVVAAPPPYSPPTSPMGGVTTALLGSPEAPEPSIAWPSRRAGGFSSDTDSYAEHPPPTPPPGGSGVGYTGPDIEDSYFSPPPSFAIAIRTPIPAILAGLSGVSSPAPAASPSLDSRPTTPASPIIPLLAPPPSSRPVSLSRPSEQGSDAGSSRTQPLSSPRAQAPPSSSQASVRSLQIHVADEPRVADADANSIRHSLPDSNRLRISAPALIPPITPAAQSTHSQEPDGRSEGDRTSTHL